jgi:DNA-binding IclR family transcriptional regulator
MRTQTVGSVDNALRLLSALRTRSSLAVKEAAELLDVAPSTAHRLLGTLQRHGFVSQDPGNRRYGAGPALLEVALASLDRVDVRRVARPHLVALAAEVRETTSLVVSEGTRVRFIDSAEGPETVRVADRTGEVLPAHSTSVGKAMLAALSDADIVRLYPDEDLPVSPGSPEVSRSSLVAELKEVRAQGYAASFDQSPTGLSAVGVPITDGSGTVLAAIGVSAPASRLNPLRVPEIVSAATERARRIGEELRSPPDLLTATPG